MLNRERYDNGRLKAADKHETDDNHGAAAWNRIKEAGVRKLVDARLGTTIGRASMLGNITSRQAAAANLIARAYGTHERLQGLPRRNAASPDYDRAWGDSVGWGGETVPEVERRISKARKRFERVSDMIPHGQRSLIEALCVESRYLSEIELAQIKPVLDRVADGFGM